MPSKEQEIELAWEAHEWSRNQHPSLTPALRTCLAESQNWRCCYCGVRMMGRSMEDDAPTFEHIIRTADGGTDDRDNIAIACGRCNNTRLTYGRSTLNEPGRNVSPAR